jgi:selenocysteine lyase/cysteine desulfurase
MGPHGAAFLYVRREVLDRLEPSIVGWHGVRDSVIARLQSHQDVFGSPFDLTKAEVAGDATRFEWGTWAVVAVEGARAALKFTIENPAEERWPLIRRLNERLVDGLRTKGRQVTSPLDEARLSGIVTFQVDNPAQVAKRLMEAHIVVAPRVNALRVSPHFYNTDAEVDKLVEKL